MQHNTRESEFQCVFFLLNRKFQDKSLNFEGEKLVDNFLANNKEKQDKAVQDSINKFKIQLGIDAPNINNTKDNTFIGLSKPILVVSGLIIAFAIGYKLYQNYNNKQ